MLGTTLQIAGSTADVQVINMLGELASINGFDATFMCKLSFYAISADNGAMRPMIGSSNTNKIAYLGARGVEGNDLRIHALWGGLDYSTRSISVPSSDIRLKDNIMDTEIRALPIIDRIKMRQFDWIETGKHQSIGFIADELEKIDPKLAVGGGYTEDGLMDIKSVDTFYLLGYITKALQELHDIVREQDRKIQCWRAEEPIDCEGQDEGNNSI